MIFLKSVALKEKQVGNYLLDLLLPFAHCKEKKQVWLISHRHARVAQLKPGSQYDASLALRPLRCDKILKTDWSNTMQLTQNRIRSYLALRCV